jgi:membrane-bound ClpP family serine protease
MDSHSIAFRAIAALVFAFLAMCATRATAAESVSLIRISGTIGPATSSYIERALDEAAKDNALCAIIQLDTPGGLLESTKDIVQTLYSATVPTAVFVAPSGGTAASAGCFITLAADIAARRRRNVERAKSSARESAAPGRCSRFEAPRHERSDASSESLHPTSTSNET